MVRLWVAQYCIGKVKKSDEVNSFDMVTQRAGMVKKCKVQIILCKDRDKEFDLNSFVVSKGMEMKGNVK